MKKINKFLQTIALLCITAISYGQPDWNTQGNVGTTLATDFLGTTDNKALQFGTGGTFPQMILNTNGRFGIGLNTAQNLFHQHMTGNTSNFHQFTNGNTSNTAATNGFMVGIRYNTTTAVSDAELNSHQQGANMHFLTSNQPRMQIYESGAGAANDGYVGIGDFTAFSPNELLHQHSTSTDPWRRCIHQFTTATTGTLPTNGLLVGLSNDEGYINIQEDMPIHFFTNSGANNDQKMVIGHNSTNTARVGIGKTGTPFTHLQIGLDAAGNTGYRTWMDKGVLMYGSLLPFPDVAGSDNMYVGLREIASDVSESIVSWGDNPTGTQEGDRLRFLFTAGATSGFGVASSTNGLEMARMITEDGNNPRIGFGDMFTPNVDPQNTVEIRSSASSPKPAGLRFTNLTNGSTATANATNKVLSVDNQGDVVLVYDIGGGTVSNTCANTNIMARWTSTGPSLACSDIYNDYSNSKVGIFNTSPNYNMHVLKPAMYSDVSGYWNLTHNPTPHEYTLGVGCDIANNFHTGIGLFSYDGSTAVDRMQMYADDHAIGILRTFYAPYVIMNHENQAQNAAGTYIPTATLGTIPNTAGVVVANDFYEEAKSPTMGSLANKYQAKLWVESNDWIIPASGTYNNGLTPIMALNKNTRNTTTTALYGLQAYCSGTRAGSGSSYTRNYGGEFYAGGADINYAIHSYATNASALTNVAGQFTANSAQYINYGIRSYAPIITCNATACANAAGYFSGWVYNTGNYVPSDASLKTNIQPLQFDDAILRNLPIYSYNFLTNNNFGMPLPDGNHYGVMANELQAVLPDMVRTFINPEERDSLGNIITQEKVFDAVNYTELVPLLIAGYQQQANKLDSLTDALTALQATVNNCCNIQPRLGNNNGNDEAMTVELENVKAIVLNQNEPNPFAEQTTITWNISTDDSSPLNAMLMFYDNTGSILKTVKINETGPGTLLVYGSKLSQGIYTYSLVVNNKTIDSKKMVKSK